MQPVPRPGGHGTEAALRSGGFCFCSLAKLFLGDHEAGPTASPPRRSIAPAASTVIGDSRENGRGDVTALLIETRAQYPSRLPEQHDSGLAASNETTFAGGGQLILPWSIRSASDLIYAGLRTRPTFPDFVGG